MNKGNADVTKMLAIGKQVIEEAERQGADQAKVVGTINETLRITNENREFTMANSLSAEAFGLGVHKDQRKGSATVNSTDMDDLSNAVNEALGLARYSVPDEHLVMPEQSEASVAKPLDFLHDPEMLNVTPKQIESLMTQCLTTHLADKRIAVERFEFSIGSSVHTLVTSKGVVQSETQTGASWSIVGMARDGNEVSGMDYLGSHAFSWSDVEAQIIADCRDFAATVLANLKPIHCPAYQGVVVLSPRAVRPLLISTLLYHASGSSVMDNKSRWADKLGQSVADARVSLSDNPHDARLSGATAYDGDGLPTRWNNIVERGVLMQHLHSCYSAKRTGKQSNAMSGGPFGLTLDHGESSRDELLKLNKSVLLVNRFSGNVDPLTGDFSGVAKSSHLYEDGNNMGPVQETMIAGNVFESLRNIVAISKETMNVSSSFVAPWIAVDGVSVS